MQTGNIADWTSDPNTWGALYPFVGSEVLWVILALVIWLVWTFWQMRFENKVYEEEVAHLKKGKNLEKALDEYQVSPHPFFTE
ncbi:MAG: hypothetical protein AAF702_02555 [Chloroflexota bacterium]